MIITNLFESPEIGRAVANLNSLLKAADAGESAEIIVGNEPVTLDYNETKFLAGQYRSFLKAGRQEEFIQSLADPIKFDRHMRVLRDLLDRQKNLLSGGSQSVEEDGSMISPTGPQGMTTTGGTTAQTPQQKQQAHIQGQKEKQVVSKLKTAGAQIDQTKINQAIDAQSSGRTLAPDQTKELAKLANINLSAMVGKQGGAVTDLTKRSIQPTQGMAEDETTHLGGKVKSSNGVTRHTAGQDVYGGSDFETEPDDIKVDKSQVSKIERALGVKWDREKKWGGGVKVDEVSNDLLGRYKKAAGADASAADKRGDFKHGDKRFSGIVKATKKQFANDIKKHYDSKEQGVAEEVDTGEYDARRPTHKGETTPEQEKKFRDKVRQYGDELEQRQKEKEQGVAEAATDDPKFQKMMGAIQKNTPDPVGGYVAVSYASEQPSKKIRGATVNGRALPATTDNPGQLIKDLKFTPDRIEQQLTVIGQKYGWDLVEPGQGQGYTDVYFDTNKEFTTHNQKQLAAMIVKTVAAINKYFSDMNRSLQATGLPAYQTNVWQGMGANGNIRQIDDINKIAMIAQGKTAESDAGPAIGRMILKYIPEYEAENDELGYDPEDFANAKKVASIYIAKGERAGLQAQGKLDSHVSEMIDELLSDKGGSGLRTIWDLDEGERHQRDMYRPEADRRPDTSNSLASRDVVQAEVPNVTKSKDGHPTVQWRGDTTRKTVNTRVEPTITKTHVDRLDKDTTVPKFLKLKEFAPGDNAGSGNGDDYLRALASAWLNQDLSAIADQVKQDKNPKKKGMMDRVIDAQRAVEKILERGIVCGDGKVRKFFIDYNSDFDGVRIVYDDYAEYSDYDDDGNDIDSRTGKPWPHSKYDEMEFKDHELDESMTENRSSWDSNMQGWQSREQASMDAQRRHDLEQERNVGIEHEDDPRWQAQNRPQSTPVLKGYYFYQVNPDDEYDAKAIGLKQTKSGKWALPVYNTSGRNTMMKKNTADSSFGAGRWWEPKK
jgi:hypothetical protein